MAASGRLEDRTLGYLVGEKLLHYIHVADSDPSWDANVPKFVAEIRQIFTNAELQGYFATAARVGVAGQVCTEEQYATTLGDATPFRHLVAL